MTAKTEDHLDLSGLPDEAVGLRLCKMRGEDLILCEPVVFTKGRSAVDTVLRRAAINGPVGPIGETGNYWADILSDRDTWVDTISLSREAWNGLKNHWMRCKISEAA